MHIPIVHEACLHAKHAKTKGSESLATPKKILKIWTLFDRISGHFNSPKSQTLTMMKLRLLVKSLLMLATTIERRRVMSFALKP